MKIRPWQDSQLGCFGRDFAEISAIFSRDRGLGRTLQDPYFSSTENLKNYAYSNSLYTIVVCW